jgi:hypothetical protein
MERKRTDKVLENLKLHNRSSKHRNKEHKEDGIVQDIFKDYFQESKNKLTK